VCFVNVFYQLMCGTSQPPDCPRHFNQLLNSCSILPMAVSSDRTLRANDNCSETSKPYSDLSFKSNRQNSNSFPVTGWLNHERHRSRVICKSPIQFVADGSRRHSVGSDYRGVERPADRQCDVDRDTKVKEIESRLNAVVLNNVVTDEGTCVASAAVTTSSRDFDGNLERTDV